MVGGLAATLPPRALASGGEGRRAKRAGVGGFATNTGLVPDLLPTASRREAVSAGMRDNNTYQTTAIIKANETPMPLQLSIGLTANPRTWPILDGKVKADGIELIPTKLHPSELFWRQLRFADFDLSEMSISSLMIARSRGDDRWIGVPVFTTKRFSTASCSSAEMPGSTRRPTCGQARRSARVPADRRALGARRAAARIRRPPRDMEFWMERTPTHSHGGATGFTPPPGVTIHPIPVEKNVGSMMASGELDAALHYHTAPTRCIGAQSTSKAAPTSHAVPRSGRRRRSLLPQDRYLSDQSRDDRAARVGRAASVAGAQRAQGVRPSDDRRTPRLEQAEYHLAAGLLGPEAEGAATPLLRHGITANRTVLETAARYSYEQGLTPRLMKLEELFAAKHDKSVGDDTISTVAVRPLSRLRGRRPSGAAASSPHVGQSQRINLNGHHAGATMLASSGDKNDNVSRSRRKSSDLAAGPRCSRARASNRMR